VTNFSSTFKEALSLPETDEVIIVLITIDHSTFLSPIRVSSDGVDTLSRGDTYVSFPFDLRLPRDAPNGVYRAQLTVDNIDKQIVEALRLIPKGAAERPMVTMEIVLHSDPDHVEASMPDYILSAVSYNKLTVTGDLSVEKFLNMGFPHKMITPGNFPAAF